MDMFPLAYAYDTLPPVADAGEDHNVLAGTVVTLDGSGSVDDGVIIRYTWTFTFADTPVDLEGETTTFPFLLIGSYPVTLEVEDAWGNTGLSFITVDVYDDEAPVANAGDDIVIEMGTAFGFNGTASTDNGFIVTYEWNVDPEGLDRVVEGEAAMFTIDVPGDYPAVLRIYDEAGNSDIDDITIHVLDTEDPVADAGRDFAANQMWPSSRGRGPSLRMARS